MANGSSSSDDHTGRSVSIHWFRQTDLRLHDNPALCRTAELSCGKATKKLPVGASAASSSKPNPSGIVPVFIFDTTRIYGSNVRSKLGCLKCGPRRAKFVLEAVADLRSNLEKRGSGLIVAVGKPEIVLADIVKSAILRSDNIEGGVKINVVCQEEVCSEELSVDKAVRAELAKAMSKGNKFHFETVWGSTMYDPNTLPYDGNVFGIPDTFTPFRNQVEKHCKIGNPLDEPNNAELTMPPDIKDIVNDSACRESLTYMPELADLGYSAEDIDSASHIDSRSAMPKNYCGGETFALERVKDYIWEKDLLKIYFDTRNGMIGADYSTKFAPWLALGNVSPRYIARECRRYEETRVQNKSTYWVVFELLWRDYCKFFAKKYGDRIFYPNGILGASSHPNKRKWGMDPKQIQAWKDGMTGYPLVDANMRELAATGFMSNRGRQNVCSFLTIDMNMDWRYGGDYFEKTLLDYDVHSNYVNWLAGAGMTGGRLNRFNIVKQSKDYDFGGDYVRLWCPELKNVPDNFVHEPWKMSAALMEECGVKIGPGRDYPSPIVNPDVLPKIMNGGGRGGGGRGNGRGGRSGGGRGGFHERNKRDKGSRAGSYAFDSKYI
jgi:deoxyribodipyrimidine photo-lyase